MSPVGALRLEHASGLHNVTTLLSDLHRQRLREAGGEAATVRTSVLTIVAACTDAALADRAAADLVSIGTRHPARAIVILAAPEAAARLEADVSLQCSSDGSRVCTEMVRIDVSGEAAYHLTSIVTPLLLPDVPVQLWLVGAPPVRQAFSPEAVALCERLVLDSGAYADAHATLALLAAQLDSHGDALSLADIAWERTRVWRHTLAQAFDSERARQLLRGVGAVRIRSAGTEPRADALLLAGWLRSRLDWPERDGTALALEVDPDAGTAPGSICALELDLAAAGSGWVRLRGDAAVLHSDLQLGAAPQVSRTTAMPRLENADLLARLFGDPVVDPVYPAALRQAAGLAP